MDEESDASDSHDSDDTLCHSATIHDTRRYNALRGTLNELCNNETKYMER